MGRNSCHIHNLKKQNKPLHSEMNSLVMSFRQASSFLRTRYGKQLLNKAKAQQLWNETLNRNAEKITVARFTEEELAQARPVHDAVKSRPLTLNNPPAARMKEIHFDHDPYETTMLMEKTNPFRYFTKD